MAIFNWWLAIQLIGLLALPLTTWLFRFLPGRGLPWSKAVGLLFVGWAAWLLAMINLVPFGLSAVLVACCVLAGASWYVQRGRTRADLRLALRRGWRSWLAYEVLFGLVLWAGLQLRMYGLFGSAIHYTEKPMELMLLSSVLNSPTFPPQDFWLAGYSINYYYLGYVLVAVLKLLSGVGLGVAFNLAVATIYALTALGIAGIIATLIGLRFPHNPEAAPGTMCFGTLAAAGLGVILVLAGGNQLGALQRIVGSAQVNLLDDAQRMAVLSQALRRIAPRTVDPATVKGVWDGGQFSGSSTLTPMDPTNFDAWAPSRAMYDDVGTGIISVDGVQREGIRQDQVITEFPFFSFYLGDLHPHVLALPFVLLVVALALATLVRSTLPIAGTAAFGRIELVFAGLMLGSLYMLNSWDAPTYGFLYAVALALLVRRMVPERGWRWWVRYARQLAPVLLTALVLFAPFLLTFDSFAGQDQVPPPFDTIPIIRTLGRTLGPVLDHSGWTDILAIFGLFLVPLLAWALREVPDRLAWGLVGGTLIVGLVLGIPALACAPLAWLLARAAWRVPQQPAQAFALLLGSLGALLLFVSDILYLRDNFDRRFNTVFKVYFQVWFILGIVAAFCVWELLHSGRWRRITNVAWILPFGVLLAGSLVYPVSVLSPTTTPGGNVPPALDGLQYSNQFTSGVREAAAWLAANSVPTARLVGAPGNSYDTGGEVATLSGRPTLLGWWQSHENLWRTKQPEARSQISARINDIATIYTASDITEVRRLLESNQVDYILVGPQERRAYPNMPNGMLEQVARQVYSSNDWQIYQVTR